MPSGFQLFNTSGTFQIDGMFPQFVMRRKVTVNATLEIYGDGGVDDTYWQTSVNIANDEILAICPSDWAAIGNRFNNGDVQLICQNYNTQVECFIFGQVRDIGLRQGFQVFNPSGVLCFDALQPMFAMTGFPVGDGDFYYTGGRKYAAVCMNQELEVKEEWFGAGGYDYVRRTNSRTMLQSLGSGMRIRYRKYWKRTEDVSNGYNIDAVKSNTPSRHIIVDVTNF